MNRIVTAGVALVAALALCSTGAGSMAFWQQSAQTTEVSFETGELRLEPVGTPVWASRGAPLDDTFRPVPGDTLTYTQEFDLLMAGTTIAATIRLAPGTVITSAGSSFTLDGVALTGAATFTPDPAASQVGADQAWTVDSGGRFTLTLTLGWNAGTAVDDAAQGATITINPSELLLVQEATAA